MGNSSTKSIKKVSNLKDSDIKATTPHLNLIKTEFFCKNCNLKFQKEYKWELSRAGCPKCGKEIINDLELIDDNNEKKEIRRKPLTDWEKKKLEFYRDEKKWHQDIESRRILSNGDVAIVDHKGRITEVRNRK